MNNLLLIDLSARVPYSVKVSHPDYEDLCSGVGGPQTLSAVYSDTVWQGGAIRCECDDLDEYPHDLELCKPYLRPIDTMTEKEVEEFVAFTDTMFRFGEDEELCVLPLDAINWLLAHHFDIPRKDQDGVDKTMIERGLALPAPPDMYKTK